MILIIINVEKSLLLNIFVEIMIFFSEFFDKMDICYNIINAFIVFFFFLNILAK